MRSATYDRHAQCLPCETRALSEDSSADWAAAVSKRGYHGFNPVPNNLLRELRTDRPDKTESPYTVDADHFQVEMDALTYFHDKTRETRVERYGIGIANVKVGLLP